MEEVSQKINNLINVIDTAEKKNMNREEQIKKAKEESNKFLQVLTANVKQGAVSYDNALLRIKKFARDGIELHWLIDQLDQSIWSHIKTASIKEGDSKMTGLEKLSQKLPKYASWIRDQLKKDGYYLGTGKEINHKDEIRDIEQKRLDESIKGGERLMKRDMDQKNRVNRAYYNGTGDKVDSAKWDNNVGAEEEKRMKAQISTGESKAKADKKEKERVQRARERFSVKLALDLDNNRASKWIVADRSDGEILFDATVDDILEGREATDAVIKELTSPEYGEMIYEGIGTDGVASTAHVMLGDKFTKAAADFVSIMKDKDEENEDEENEDEENEDKENKDKENKEEENGEEENEEEENEEEENEEEENGEEENEEGENGLLLGGTKSVPATKASSNEVQAKQASVSVEYFTLKGVHADLKQEAAKIKTASLDEGLEEVDNDMDELKSLIQDNSEDITAIASKSEKITKKLSKLDEKILRISRKSKKKKEDKKKEEKEEKEEKGIDKKVKAFLNKVKQAAKADSKDYGVTSDNYESEFHKGQGNSKDLPDTTVWAVKKEMEKLITKKPTGRIAKVMNKIKTATSEAVDGKVKNEMKDYLEKITGDSAYSKGLVTDKEVGQVEKELPKGAQLIQRTKEAMDLAERMQKVGMLLNKTKEARDKQVDTFLRMSADQFEAYKESVENINPTSELEDGRYKIEVIDEPNRDVKASIDGKEVAYFKASELGAVKGHITKKALLEALSQAKYGFEEGLFDKTLSGGKAESTDGEQVDLNVAVDQKRLLDNRLNI